MAGAVLGALFFGRRLEGDARDGAFSWGDLMMVSVLLMLRPRVAFPNKRT